MTRRGIWGAAVGTIFLMGIVIASLTLVPQLLYPPLPDVELRAVATTETRIQLQQAQAQLQNNVRSTLLQLTAGLLVVGGAAATWRQVHVNHEGQITERFTRAIEQIGNDNVDIRIGAVYALERIARNSPADRRTVQFILAAYVRNRAPWHVGAPGGPEHPTATIEKRPWLQIIAPDVQAAVAILARRLPPLDTRKIPYSETLMLARVDLRGLQLHPGRCLINTQLRYANLARSWVQGTRFDRSDLKSADLRGCRLEDASFVDASLNKAYLTGANLRNADLRRADLRGADLRDTNLDGARLEGARADTSTIWPSKFDPERLLLTGVLLIQPESNTPKS